MGHFSPGAFTACMMRVGEEQKEAETAKTLEVYR